MYSETFLILKNRLIAFWSYLTNLKIKNAFYALTSGYIKENNKILLNFNYPKFNFIK
jgi:hypothetical protein